MMQTGTQRTFIAGTEWLYYTIYIGPQTADKFLTDFLAPQVRAMISESIIDKWFFIRYRDEKGMHLRVRFHLKEVHLVGVVVGRMEQALAPFIQKRLVSDVSINTYKRELERYGIATICEFETLFFINSELAVDLIAMTDDTSEKKWLLGIKAIDVFLNGWQFDLDQKKELLEELKTGFGREFGIDKFARKHLNRKYRDNRDSIEDIIMNGDPDFDVFFQRYEEGNTHSIASIKKKLELLEPGNTDLIKDYLGSYIHMLCNRLFPSKQRLSECILYDLMFEFYYSKQARIKLEIKKKRNQY